jgi:cytochrome c oxidase assembly protein subunit 11
MSVRSSSRSNKTLALGLGGVVVAMVALSFAAVPLYRIFCQVTGFGGTTQVAKDAPGATGDRHFKIRFNADVNPELDWAFQPQQREMTVQMGEAGLAFYRAENRAEQAVTGTATFNVTPLKAGQYFNKIECFCFTEQRLAAGEAVDMPVTFFVDPAIADDPNLAEVTTITLSYTFFRDPDDREASGEEQVTELGAQSGLDAAAGSLN